MTSPVELPDGSVRALVVDAHPLTRIGLGVLLKRQPWVEACVLAADVEEGAALAERHRPDVAVVDISDLGPFVRPYLTDLRERRPSMPIVLSAYCARPSHALLLKTGDGPLLTSDLSLDQVVAVIRAVLVEQEPPASQEQTPALGSESLSQREREVLVLLSTGATNREIAAVMHVGTDAIKKHTRTLYRKLGVRNRTEAAQRAAALIAA